MEPVPESRTDAPLAVPAEVPHHAASEVVAHPAASEIVPHPSAEHERELIRPRRTPMTLRMLRGGWEWAKSFQLAIVLFLVVRAFFVEAFTIPSGSMEGTLLVGDFLLVNKLLYGAEVPFTGKHLPPVRELRYGDVVIFQWPEDPKTNFVKRLVGLPGDRVEMRQGAFYRNGELQRETYAVRSDPGFDPASEGFRWQRDYVTDDVDVRGYHPSRDNWGPLVVPPGHFFTLGDNRDNSLDSRYWGFVPDSLVRGSPIFVYYSFAPDSGASMSWLTRVRWQRLGERIH